MAWCLLRALCCCYNNRGLWQRSATSVPSQYYYDVEYFTDDDDDDESVDIERNMEIARKKQAAIAATVDAINTKRLLNKHNDDSGLLMYRCESAMHKAYDRLAAATRDNRSVKASRFTRDGSRFHIV